MMLLALGCTSPLPATAEFIDAGTIRITLELPEDPNRRGDLKAEVRSPDLVFLEVQATFGPGESLWIYAVVPPMTPCVPTTLRGSLGVYKRRTGRVWTSFEAPLTCPTKKPSAPKP